MNESKYLDFVKIELEKKCFKYISCEIVEDDLGIFDKKYRFLKFVSEHYPVPELENLKIPFFCLSRYVGSLIESYILDILTPEQRPFIKARYGHYSGYVLCCNYNPLAKLVNKLGVSTAFDFEFLLECVEKDINFVFDKITGVEIEIESGKKEDSFYGSISERFKLGFDNSYNYISHVNIDESKIVLSQLCKYVKIFNLFINYFKFKNYSFYYEKRINALNKSYLIEIVMPDILYSMIKKSRINFDYSDSENAIERFSEIENLVKDAIFESVYKVEK